jgi:peptidoglycan LD-endopeptidase LytH
VSQIIIPPVRPFRGTRGVDSWGSGVFGASRDGGGRQHLGLDFTSVTGDVVVAPFPGVITRVGIAYPNATLGSIHLQGDGDFSGWRAKLLYVRPEDGLMGRAVLAGDVIGSAQDVATYWHLQEPSRVGMMVNHCHLEIAVTEARNVDPAHFLPPDLIVPAGLRT